ncbi:hypothetical protein B0H66DRAFT_308942 [Apodospora peruviana]|uniref:Uncharacterized protein n=1 Tax=Apodospora peruviana TaxID=516989 RepID=A0AAE0I1Y3_9PEZI|nr:hypothetical protein B0H66DRAFT_308942 [Apodospora peruviana]
MAYQQVGGHSRAPSGETVSTIHEDTVVGDAAGPYSDNTGNGNLDHATTSPGNTGYTAEYQQWQLYQQQFQQNFPQQFINVDEQQQQQSYQQQYQQPQHYPQDQQQQDAAAAPGIERLQPVPLVTSEKNPAEARVSPLGWQHRKSRDMEDSSSTRSSTGSLFSKANSWSYETMSILLAFAAVGGIVAVLAYFDEKPLPSWPSSITINAVIAILATIATASMSVPLSSGLGQLKWIQFKQGRAPLSDMEIFDDASRGAFGALNLLFRGRGGFAASFGSFVMVIALFLSPFSQQIATYPMRRVHASHLNATNLRSVNYGAALHGQESLAAFVPILPLKSAVYYGLFAENNKPWLNLQVDCQTGNCTWDPIDTLAICHSCVDMSEYMSRYCADGMTGDACGWELPSGAKLNSSAEVFSMTSLFPEGAGDSSYSTLMKLIFMGTEAQNGLAGELRPWAQQCTLSACVQTLNSSIEKGELSETVVKTVTNDTVPRGADAVRNLEPVTISATHPNGTLETYTLSREVVLAMQLWFSHLFRNGTASRNAEFINQTLDTVPGSANVLVNLTVGISSGETFFDTDIVQAFYWNYYEYKDGGGLEMLVRDLAVSMTVSLRDIGGEKVEGKAFINETYVHVRWGFVAVPLLAVVMAGVFLLTAIWKTRSSGTRLWKTSALAMLFHGLDEDARERFEDLKGLEAKMREAKGVKVKLEQDEGGRASLRIDRLY